MGTPKGPEPPRPEGPAARWDGASRGGDPCGVRPLPGLLLPSTLPNRLVGRSGKEEEGAGPPLIGWRVEEETILGGGTEPVYGSRLPLSGDWLDALAAVPLIPSVFAMAEMSRASWGETGSRGRGACGGAMGPGPGPSSQSDSPASLMSRPLLARGWRRWTGRSSDWKPS